MFVTCFTEEDLVPAAKKLLETHFENRIFAFYGKMGAGKTTFIKAICKVLEVSDTVQSPTFSIINEYDRVSGDSIYHMDFYRVKKLEEVFDIGYEDYIYSGHYCFIEWPELIESLLPPGLVKVQISEEFPTGTRMVEF